jgi:hypothetical protein
MQQSYIISIQKLRSSKRAANSKLMAASSLATKNIPANPHEAKPTLRKSGLALKLK